MDIKLSSLADSLDISNSWEEKINEKFIIGNYYTIYKSPLEWIEILKKSENANLKSILNNIMIKVIEKKSNDLWEISILEKGKNSNIFSVGISDGMWTVITDNKRAFLKYFNNLVKYSRGISNCWISPPQMKEIVGNYAKIGSIRAISKTPSFQIPNKADIPAKEISSLPEFFFQNLGITIQIWAPKEILNLSEYSNNLYTKEFKISLEHINRISKSTFITKFDNPGSSTISLDSNGTILHEKGTPKATEKVYENVYNLASSWIEKSNEFLPEYEIIYDTENKNDIINIKLKKKANKMKFSIEKDEAFEKNELLKLEQILISGSSKTELAGFRLSHEENSVFNRVFYSRFSQDALVESILDTNSININITPSSNTGPHILAHIYRSLSEKFAWRIGDISNEGI